MHCLSGKNLSRSVIGGLRTGIRRDIASAGYVVSRFILGLRLQIVRDVGISSVPFQGSYLSSIQPS